MFEPDDRRRLHNAVRAYSEFIEILNAAERVSGSTRQHVEFRAAVEEAKGNADGVRIYLGVMRGEFPHRGITRAKTKDVSNGFWWLSKCYVRLMRPFRGTRLEKHLVGPDRALERLRFAVNELFGPTTPFQRELNKVMAKCEVTPSTWEVTLDSSYVYRLLRGENRNPSRNAVLALAASIETHSSENDCGISPRDLNRLVKSAGFRPPRRKWRPS